MDEQASPELANSSKSIVKNTEWYNNLKPRQRKFIRRYIECKNRVTAWMETHKSKDRAIAAISVSRFMREHPQITDFFYQMAGIGDDDIIKVIRESMNAKRQNIYRGQVHEFDDPYARLKAVEVAMKVRGLDKPAVQNQNNVVIIADPSKGIFKVEDGEVIDGNQ